LIDVESPLAINLWTILNVSFSTFDIDFDSVMPNIAFFFGGSGFTSTFYGI